MPYNKFKRGGKYCTKNIRTGKITCYSSEENRDTGIRVREMYSHWGNSHWKPKRKTMVRKHMRIRKGKKFKVQSHKRNIKGHKIKKRMAWDIDRAKKEAERQEAWDVEMIPVEDIDPRRREFQELEKEDELFFNLEGDSGRGQYEPLDKLAEMIESKDILVEIPSARRIGDRYEVEEGRHRAMAAIGAGHEGIPLLLLDSRRIKKERPKTIKKRMPIFLTSSDKLKGFEKEIAVAKIEEEKHPSLAYTLPGSENIFINKPQEKVDEDKWADLIGHEELHNILSKEASEDASTGLDEITAPLVLEDGKLQNPETSSKIFPTKAQAKTAIKDETGIDIEW